MINIILILAILVYPVAIDARAVELRDLPVENVYVYNNGIEIGHNTGNSTSCSVPDAWGDNITLLHNHPSIFGLQEGFSYQDLKSAATGNVSTMVLVTQRGIWETKKPYKQWNFTKWANYTMDFYYPVPGGWQISTIADV